MASVFCALLRKKKKKKKRNGEVCLRAMQLFVEEAEMKLHRDNEPEDTN